MEIHEREETTDEDLDDPKVESVEDSGNEEEEEEEEEEFVSDEDIVDNVWGVGDDLL